MSDCYLAVSPGKTDVADTRIVVHKIDTCPCIKKGQYITSKTEKKTEYIKVDGTSFLDAGSLVTTAHVTCEICQHDLRVHPR